MWSGYIYFILALPPFNAYLKYLKYLLPQYFWAISFFLSFMISRYVLMIFWVGTCGCFVAISRNSYCCKRHKVNYILSWVSYFLVLKSNVCDDWSFLFWRLAIFIFVFCLNFASSMTIFFSWELMPFTFNGNPLGFAVFSREFDSKWLICLRYFMVFEPYCEHKYSSGKPHLC